MISSIPSELTSLLLRGASDINFGNVLVHKTLDESEVHGIISDLFAGSFSSCDSQLFSIVNGIGNIFAVNIPSTIKPNITISAVIPQHTGMRNNLYGTWFSKLQDLHFLRGAMRGRFTPPSSSNFNPPFLPSLMNTSSSMSVRSSSSRLSLTASFGKVGYTADMLLISAKSVNVQRGKRENGYNQALSSG